MRYARVHIYISGRVQGVFFRSNMRRRALQLGLKGWVRNLPDGRVEAVVEGEEDKIRSLIEWCKVGPPWAVVTSVDVKWEPYRGEFETFRIRY